MTYTREDRMAALKQQYAARPELLKAVQRQVCRLIEVFNAEPNASAFFAAVGILVAEHGDKHGLQVPDAAEMSLSAIELFASVGQEILGKQKEGN